MQHAATGLHQEPTDASAICSDTTLSAVTSATQLPWSATCHEISQSQASAAEAEVPPDAACAQASGAVAEVSHEGRDGITACSQQLTSQDGVCQLQQSDTQPSAQQTSPDMRGTLSHQIQVSSKFFTVKWLNSNCTKLVAWSACHKIVLTGIGSKTQHLCTCCRPHDLLPVG